MYVKKIKQKIDFTRMCYVFYFCVWPGVINIYIDSSLFVRLEVDRYFGNLNSIWHVMLTKKWI